jgi:hypothetical protein
MKSGGLVSIAVQIPLSDGENAMAAKLTTRSTIMFVFFTLGFTGCVIMGANPEIGTGRRFRDLAQHLDSLEAPLPDRLEGLCSRGLACGVSDTTLEFQDGWKRRLAYTPGASTYERRSFGEDGLPGTPDDLVFVPQLERQWRDRLAGCFHLSSAATHIPSEFQLDTAEAGYRIYRVTPDTEWRYAVWWPMSETTAILIRQDRYHDPTTLRLSFEGDQVSAFQISRPSGRVGVERISCPRAR